MRTKLLKLINRILIKALKAPPEKEELVTKNLLIACDLAETAVTMLIVFQISLVIGTPREAFLGMILFSVFRIGHGIHSDWHIDCMCISVCVFTLICAYCKLYSKTIVETILVILIVTGLFIKWGTVYEKLKKHTKKMGRLFKR